MWFQVHSPPMNDSERHTQFVIREKLQGCFMAITKCRATLLTELLHEMKDLKEELDNGKPGKKFFKQ